MITSSRSVGDGTNRLFWPRPGADMRVLSVTYPVPAAIVNESLWRRLGNYKGAPVILVRLVGSVCVDHGRSCLIRMLISQNERYRSKQNPDIQP